MAPVVETRAARIEIPTQVRCEPETRCWNGTGNTMVTERGFSLLELIVVMAIIGILVVYALPAFQDAVVRAKEAVLKEDLVRMRDALEQYLTDRGVYPEALEDLVTEGYLRQMPVDPITGADDSWEVEYAPWMMVDQGQPAGIWNLYSGAEGEGLSGVPYAEW